MIDRAEAWLRTLRMRVSRSEWSVRRLGLSISEQTEAEPGLVVIHIPELGRDVLQDAIAAQRMPFCHQLMRVENYRLHELACGRGDETVLQEVADPQWNGHASAPTVFHPSVAAAHGWTYVRAATRMPLEGAMAIGDVVQGRTRPGRLWPRLKQIPAQVRRNVVHRDFVVAGAAMDAARGLPMIHVSLPEYRDGMWRGLDAAVRRIWHSARRSARRDYDVWVCSSDWALLPADAPIADHGRDRLHVSDLRDAALHLLGRAPLPATARPFGKPRQGSLRIMTYNVHSCLGMDGKLSPLRIARVIAQCDPDIVALQELDVGRVRTRAVDQAHAIAQELKMEFHFHPAIALEEELYGDAVLSRYPMRLVRAAPLPGLAGRSDQEPRGALWVSVQVNGRELQLINTHLGLSSVERMAQVEAILGPQWLAHADCRGPTVLCGDLNALPRSQVCRRLAGTLADAQLCLDGHQPRHTFFGRLPIGRIDHIFVSRDLEVTRVEVPRNDLIRRASDHLPLVVEVRMK